MSWMHASHWVRLLPHTLSVALPAVRMWLLSSVNATLLRSAAAFCLHSRLPVCQSLHAPHMTGEHQGAKCSRGHAATLHQYRMAGQAAHVTDGIGCWRSPDAQVAVGATADGSQQLACKQRGHGTRWERCRRGHIAAPHMMSYWTHLQAHGYSPPPTIRREAQPCNCGFVRLQLVHTSPTADIPDEHAGVAATLPCCQVCATA